MSLFSKEIHRGIYIFGLIFLIVSLPLSEFTLSVSQFVLLGNWLFEGGHKNKFSVLKERKSVLLFISIFMIHLIGMAYSTDYKYGMHDLVIKVPLLVLPVIIATTEFVKRREFQLIWIFFNLALIASAIISCMVLFGILPIAYEDTREISIFISHIRFSLLLNIAIFGNLFLIFNKPYIISNNTKVLFFVSTLWLSLFVFVLQSLTGIIVFFVLLVFMVIYLLKTVKKSTFKYSVIVLLLIPILSLGYFVKKYNEFFDYDKVDFTKLEKRNERGKCYYHNINTRQVENGHYTWIYVNENELRQSWNEISEIKFDSLDRKGNKIMFTIVRYLASLGHTKDLTGVQKLKQEDIENIEKGETNYLYAKNKGINYRLYNVFWQYSIYKEKGNPSGHSIVQRLEYLKIAALIIKENPLFGVGTGDVKIAFKEMYVKVRSELQPYWQLRAHNQYITFVISFGIIGFALIVFMFISSVRLERNNVDILFYVFLIVILLSMINEDTLETQAGVTIFTFFYSLLLFGRKIRSYEAAS